MSTEVAEFPTNVGQKELTVKQPARALHIKEVPYEVWCRARHNANLSGVPYRDFVLRLLAESQPFPRTGTEKVDDTK